MAKRNGLLVGVLIGTAVLVVGAGAWAWNAARRDANELDANNAWIEIEKVRGGDSLVGDSDEKIRLVGIRAPFRTEPLFEESKKRTEELTAGETVRLRFDEVERDKKGRYLVYVFADDVFVNHTLVLEGLAYARLTTTTQRYANVLLAAQAEARKERRGIWGEHTASVLDEYWADSKYGNFHTPDCQERGKANPQRIVTLGSRDAAFDRVAGDITPDDVLGRVFSTFCVGK